jgi:hypothetical protein
MCRHQPAATSTGINQVAKAICRAELWVALTV